MEATRTFEILSVEHQLTLLVCVLFGVIFVGHPKYFMKRAAVDSMARRIGILFLIFEMLSRLINWLFNDATLIDMLPFSICGISAILCAVMLVNRSRTLFDLLYYFGLVGGVVSLLTPDMQAVFPMPGYLHNFFGHSFIVCAIIFMMVNYGYRPSKNSLFNAIVFCNIFMLIAGIANTSWGKNYLFLCEKPRGTTLIDYLGPWPYYIIGLELVGITFFSLLYAPYYLYDHFIQDTEKKCEQE